MPCIGYAFSNILCCLASEDGYGPVPNCRFCQMVRQLQLASLITTANIPLWYEASFPLLLREYNSTMTLVSYQLGIYSDHTGEIILVSSLTSNVSILGICLGHRMRSRMFLVQIRNSMWKIHHPNCSTSSVLWNQVIRKAQNDSNLVF